MSFAQTVAEKKFIQERLAIPYENLSQSYLRAETQLTSLSSYNFFIQKNNVASPIITEQLLNLNDQFVITSFTLGLKFIAADTPTNLQHLNAQVFTYVDTNTFTGNSVNAAGIYNSSLSMTIDRKVFLPAFPCRSFLRVPGTQTAANAWFSASAQKLTNEYPNGQYGFYPSEPTLVDGRQTINISVDLENASAIDGADISVYGVLEFRGYLVVNSKS
jgi:hypothetical protein